MGGRAVSSRHINTEYDGGTQQSCLGVLGVVAKHLRPRQSWVGAEEGTALIMGDATMCEYGFPCKSWRGPWPEQHVGRAGGARRRRESWAQQG